MGGHAQRFVFQGSVSRWSAVVSGVPLAEQAPEILVSRETNAFAA